MKNLDTVKWLKTIGRDQRQLYVLKKMSVSQRCPLRQSWLSFCSLGGVHLGKSMLNYVYEKHIQQAFPSFEVFVEN